MHKRVYEQRKIDEVESRKKRQEKETKRSKKKPEEKPKPKKAKGDKKDPPVNLLITLLGNIKMEIKRIHIRFEDDYFQHHRPFAMGLLIDSISFANVDTEWLFENPLSMAFRRQPAS